MEIVLWTAIFIVVPILILRGCNKYKFLNRIGSVIIAYIIGVIIGNVSILPNNAHVLQETTTSASILLAIPLLLLSSDIKAWFKIAHKAMLSMVLALVSVAIIIVVGFFILKSDENPWFYKISGMLMGVYSGGTPNLASLKMMLGVDENTYILVHSYDMLFSTAYLFFLMSVGYKFFTLFLKKSKNREDIQNGSRVDNSYSQLMKKKNLLPLLAALGIVLLIVASAGGLSLLFPESAQMTVIILSITTLGIGASLIPKIRNIKYTFDLGMYFILVFSFAVATMADISKMGDISAGLFNYVAISIFGSLILHSVFSKIFKIDADTMMVTSTALICSPPFVPVVAASIKNKNVILSGLTVGIIGYAIGNYLGFVLATLLSRL